MFEILLIFAASKKEKRENIKQMTIYCLHTTTLMGMEMMTTIASTTMMTPRG